MIEVKDLVYSYIAENSQTEEILKNINISIQKGEFVAVLGHNGSGKSTFAKHLNAILLPMGGKVYIDGIDTSCEERLWDVRSRVGMVFQNPDNQTVASIVEDDIAFGPENIGVPREEIGKRIDFALKAVGMEAFRNSTTSRLSGGQKQRIAIAAVLALKPRVMILDESTAMLDPRGRKEVMDVVLKLNKEENITVVLITHFPEEALLADRAIVMNHGKIVMEGKPETVFKREEELEKCSLTLPKPIQICRALQKGGLAIKDAFDAEAIATEIVDVYRALGVSAANVSEEETEQTKNVSTERGSVVCENLSYVYNPRSPFETYALNGVSLHIRSGEFFGIIGHTGSGKSTTLAAMLNHMNINYEYNIVTIEDPIEFLHSHKRSIIRQRELGGDTHSFNNALRTVLRHDPDVIMIGEMRDPESISIALTAAETGHLVLSTLHTQTAPLTIARIIDSFPSEQQNQVRSQLSNSLRAVISQQLLPRLGGGRVAAIEYMVDSPAIRNMIREGKDHQIYSTMQTAQKEGMQTMDQALLKLLREQKINREAVLENCVERAEILRQIQMY